MENTIQNIILQELEDLEGIVVFTTNLAQNFMNDEAMSRRILYKITLERPTAEVRAKIWKSMIPELSIEDAKALAEQYDLSGGQMANVVRKKSIDEVIYGDGSVTLDKLRGYCDSEQDDNSSSKSIRIGFV
jgi:SpoVK/Ycf46/Vps4 family AAA+-type ATPase